MGGGVGQRRAAQQELTGLKGDGRDRQIGQRVADEGRQKRGPDVAAHQFGQDRGRHEVQAIERREHGEDAREDAARDPLGPVGKPVKAVLDVMKRARPAALRPEEIADDLPDRPSVPALKDQPPLLAWLQDPFRDP